MGRCSMDWRSARDWIPFVAALGSTVAGCGGGGMSTYGMTMPTSAMSGMPMSGMSGYGGGTMPPLMPMEPAMQPTVTFSGPAAAQSINFGQGVSLAWS